jgi:mannose-6-phosphate isomerase
MYWVGPGVPHAIGPGVFCIEAQEPSDITVGGRKLSAYNSSATAGEEQRHRERLLGAYAYDGCTEAENLRKRRIEPILLSASSDGLSHEYLRIGAAETPCFALTEITANADFTPNPTGRCAILIVTDGDGRLVCGAGDMQIKKGDEIFISASVSNLTYVPENKPLRVIAAHPPGTIFS